MSDFQKRYLPHTEGRTNPKQVCVIAGLSHRPYIVDEKSHAVGSKDANIRVSVLTNQLIRIEVSKNGVFEDAPTQKVWFRNFENVICTFSLKGAILHIKTENTSFFYHTKSKKMKKIILNDGRVVTNFNKGNLGGTARTLDGAVGPVSLGKGLVSRGGVTTLDDSKSLIIAEDGMVVPRENKETDIYYFAYGTHYRRCIVDLFRLTGPAPLIPRWSLGNWWSRYKAYSQEEYINLMKRFISERIPITVATIDMDWHWVDVMDRFGDDAKLMGRPNSLLSIPTWIPGWTGYSWNTDLFPNYREFLQWLHDHGFKTTVNLHPANGVRCFEDMYEEMAKSMGIDPTTKDYVPFDITDKKFIDAYFKVLHHPYEKDGVDFWWIDWQQGNKTKVKGLDPLWALNHYHYLDNQHDNQRGLILSRYAEVGSHRYPLGFSGDTFMLWRVLNAQPHFTSTATNVGYTWWSHDIGGHHFGRKNDELYLRWVQLGVFSPIMRLHSTSNEFMGKEPWKSRKDVANDITSYLRLRHKLIPYLYTMNARTHFEGIALCEPMYYAYPNEEMAYEVPNEFMFGSELIVAPITKPMDSKTYMAGTKVWLPKGRFTDVFTGQIYEGGRMYEVFRGQENIPVFAKEGAIIPMDSQDTKNIWQNPESLDIMIYRGKGSFTLYEDDGETSNFQNGTFANTVFEVEQYGDDIVFTIYPVTGNVSIVPQERNFRLRFQDVCTTQDISVTVEDKAYKAKCEKDGRGMLVHLEHVLPSNKIIVVLKNVTVYQNVDKKEALIELISKFQISSNKKGKVYTDFVNNPNGKIPGSKRFKPLIQEILDLSY